MSVASKLNIKPGHTVCVLELPEGVDLELPDDVRVTDDAAAADAVVAFVTKRADLERSEPAVQAAKRDAVAWVAYPKAKQLDTDLNRDLLWQALQGRGVKPVRQVSVSEVWSALRFRPE